MSNIGRPNARSLPHQEVRHGSTDGSSECGAGTMLGGGHVRRSLIAREERRFLMTTLTGTQERKLKSELQKQRTERLALAHDKLLHVGEEHYSAFAGEVPDVGDQAMAEQLTDFANTLARRYAAAIRDIDGALIRLEEHQFGSCVDCGDDISFRRLSAYPTATRCVHCQEHYDRTHVHEATPTL
jgi:DnaK suppressor protein